MGDFNGQIERSRFTEATDGTHYRNDRTRLILIDPGGPLRHPAFAQDQDTVTEEDGVLDPKHGVFLFEEKIKAISYTMSKEQPHNLH